MVDSTVDNLSSLSLSAAVDPELAEMIRAGVHLGHAKSKTHPSMKPYVFGIRNTITLLDLVKTQEALVRAIDFLKDTAARKGLILLVGTRPAARKAIIEVAEKTGMPYFVERWIGGTLTNFKFVSKRVEYMEELERAKTSGELTKYTKKEQMKKEEEITKLNRNFHGLRNLKRLPDALFVVDITHDDLAVREAKRVKIPVAALVDTNSNFDLVDYPIPSNDDALPAVKYMVSRIGKAIEEGQKLVQESKAGESQPS